MTARFTGKVVLITGGGTGIGRATALAFGREGATVMVSGRRAEPLAETVKLIEAEGGRADHATADVSRSADVERLVATTVARHGGLHVAFNNAGVLGAGPVPDLDEDTWNAMVGTNLTGVFLSMKHEIAHMRGNGGGTIVNTASNPVTAVPGLGAYAATKEAVVALTRAAARDAIGDGVRITAVAPGPVDAPMTFLPGEAPADRDARLAPHIPIGRVGGAAEIAAAVLWLASPESAFVVGHGLVIDGGVSA
ncbi:MULTISPECIES: SDR family NAD(P)-dependent oxidoreductase [Thermomonosporaceae]|uniref:SDR family NAD(P)-dependent oxidoreductase n=1 Tax=Thermomonosporaceae TaxID=2012 RepID=UPI00255B3265|nr:MULTISPECIES: SDR family oxidoreductase [Thermomonosporaceae]MDL4775114.1 SDR family oxidoreductase [Actinomadura xylanilytica]